MLELLLLLLLVVMVIEIRWLHVQVSIPDLSVGLSFSNPRGLSQESTLSMMMVVVVVIGEVVGVVVEIIDEGGCGRCGRKRELGVGQ